MIFSGIIPTVEPIRNQKDENGHLAYQLDRIGDRFEIRFADELTFSVAPELPEGHPDSVRVRGESISNKSLVPHLYTNQILPMIKSWKGSTVLHSSSVHFREGCVGFFGKSGVGKSTLANVLSLRSNFSFWSDDWMEILIINESCFSQYTKGKTRLNPDHATHLQASRMMEAPHHPDHLDTKLVFAPTSQAQTKHARIKCLYELTPSYGQGSVTYEKLSSSQAFQSISQNVFRLDTRNKEHMKREYLQIVRLVESVPVYRLHYPHQIDQMKVTMQNVENHLNEIGNTP